MLWQWRWIELGFVWHIYSLTHWSDCFSSHIQTLYKEKQKVETLRQICRSAGNNQKKRSLLVTAIGDKLNIKRAPTPQHHYAVKYYTLNNYYIYDTLTVISSADSELRFIWVMYFLIQDVALSYGPAANIEYRWRAELQVFRKHILMLWCITTYMTSPL